jgi:hypothetical protein
VPSHDRWADGEKFEAINMIVYPSEWTVDGMFIHTEWTPRVVLGVPILESYNEYNLLME